MRLRGSALGASWRLGFAALVAMIGANSAHAAAYDFSYTASWGVLSGTIYGELQADGNTVYVSSIVNPEFDGVLGPAVPFLGTFAGYFGVPGPAIPEVTLDGTNNNVGACGSEDCFDGFYFDQAGVYAGVPEFSSFGPSYSGSSTELYETYDATQWRMVAVPQLELAAVASAPEPSTWAMMLLGFAGMGLAGYRSSRKRVAVAA